MFGYPSGLTGSGLALPLRAEAANAPSLVAQLFPFVLIFLIFYFLLIAPTRKRQKEHQKLLESLKKGDEVVTNGGLHGTVAAVEDRVVHLRISDQVKVKIEKSAIAGLASEPPKEPR